MKKFSYEFVKDGKAQLYQYESDEDLEKLISVTSISVETGEETLWILNLEDFLPFYSDPGFREQTIQKDKINNRSIYSLMAFWLFDRSYASNFLHNISNRTVKDMVEMYDIQDPNEVFLKSDHRVNEPEEEINGPEGEDFVTLGDIVSRGDLCFAPDPMITEYKNKKTGANLNIAVINQMRVRL